MSQILQDVQHIIKKLKLEQKDNLTNSAKKRTRKSPTKGRKPQNHKT